MARMANAGHNPFVGGPAPSMPAGNPGSGFPQTQTPLAASPTSVVIDGTPLKVIMLAGSAALGLWLLTYVGHFKFHVVVGG